ncbi:MAG: hypothetical protein ACFFD2_18955 [Promethearchaeota archaeon]
MFKNQQEIAKNTLLPTMLQDQAKKPAGINEGSLNSLFREMQKIDKVNPPGIDISILFNSDPRNPREELVNIFNDIRVVDWISELTQDYRFEDKKELFESIIKKTEKINFRKRINKITKTIKNILKDEYPSCLRFIDITGIELFDPNFILTGISVQNRLIFRGKYNTYDPITPLSENTISSMNTEDVIDYLNQRYYKLSKSVQLAMFMPDGTRIPSSVNLATWLEKNGYSIDDNIAVIPIGQIKESGNGLFEKNGWQEDQGVPSPYYPFLYDFIMVLGKKLESLNIISEERNIEGIYKYTAEINSKILGGKYLITTAADSLRTGDQFKIGQNTFNKWYVLVREKIESDTSLSEAKKTEALLDIDIIFDNLYKIFGYASANPYHRQASRTQEALAILLHDEGVLTGPYVDHLSEVLGYSSSKAQAFLDALDTETRTSPHKPNLIEERLLNNPKAYLDIFYRDQGLTGDLLNQKVEEVFSKIEAIVIPYLCSSQDYWYSEDNLLGDPDEGGVREGVKRNLLSEILHAGGHKLERLSTMKELSSFLFGHPGYLSSWVDIDNIYRRVTPIALQRIKFFATKWQISDFKNLENPISISEYELQFLKTDIIRKIDIWILSNPYKYDEHVSRGQYYVAENFRMYTRQYTQIDLIPDYELTNNLLMAAMQRKYVEFKKNNPHKSITEIPPSLWKFELSDLYEELGTKRNLWQSLGPGVQKPRWYSARSLQKILETVTQWHRDEFGDRVSGLVYTGRPSDNLFYDRNDPDVQQTLYYYQAALDSIHTYAKLRNFDLNSPTIPTIALSEALSRKDPNDPDKRVVPRELVMDYYDIAYWNKETTKAYHIIYHLCRYLGFDPWTFTTLDKEIFKGGERAGGYKRHHFLALSFRKMSSYIDDFVLTSDDFHLSEYEPFLDENGLDAEVYVKQLMKSLVDLIEMKDPNGNFIKIDENHMREVLYKNFGETEGEIILKRWKKQQDFTLSLRKFNDRRRNAFNGEYEKMLIDNYDTAYSAYFNEVSKITLTKILATRSNVDFLNIIYQGRYTFALRPIERRFI